MMHGEQLACCHQPCEMAEPAFLTQTPWCVAHGGRRLVHQAVHCVHLKGLTHEVRLVYQAEASYLQHRQGCFNQHSTHSVQRCMPALLHADWFGVLLQAMFAACSTTL